MADPFFRGRLVDSDHKKRLLRAIPGGAHTYSRGYDQFPANAPAILKRGKGAYVFDESERGYLDYGMGLRAVNVGYAEERICKAAVRQMEYGNNLTRPSLIELQAAEMLIGLIDSADMVKFTKTGSAAVSGAVKLARGFTGRELVARCAQHPFFSYDDWFVASTPLTKGIPADVLRQTKLFDYNDIASLKRLIDEFPDQIACVVLEPATDAHPAASADNPRENFLHDVQRLCKKHGIVFVLDEMITGFRWHLKGAQHYYGVTPDLSTFGKAMANGFSVTALTGKREVMEQGSIELEGRERLFLLSTTHGAEMSSLGALVETVAFCEEHGVIDHVWAFGERLIALMNGCAADAGIADHFKACGLPCSPLFSTLDKDGAPCLGLRTLFLQEMCEKGVLMPWLALCYRHADPELHKTEEALRHALGVYAKALESGYEKFLDGEPIRPVFRKHN
ncbi:glutamate-1-semialdehyde 2,1-aminomutase [Elusimicrobiota bacterium]